MQSKIVPLWPPKASILTRCCFAPLNGPAISRNTLRDSIAERGIAPICLVFIGLAQVSLRYPLLRSLGNGVRKNGVRNRCPYRRCGVDTEVPYRLPFWKEFCLFLPVRVDPGVDTEFPYQVCIVDRGVDCRDPVCRHRFRFPEAASPPGVVLPYLPAKSSGPPLLEFNRFFPHYFGSSSFTRFS